MLYGIILDSARDGIILFYGLNVWKRVVHELKLPSETFDLLTHYNDDILFNISECLVDILREGTRDTYLQFFGEDFFRYFNNLGYDKLFRVAGRTLREFLFVIDQLHDSNRFTFPQMHSPLFHVTEEDQTGITLEYKSVRHGLTHYAIGSLSGAAKTLFKENNIRLYVRSDLSTKEYAHIVFWVQFDNKTYQTKNLFNFPYLPNVTGPTFFKVFPFSILMDSSLHIQHVGSNIRKVFPVDTVLIGRPLNEVFRLIRPDIHVEWDKILSYGRHIVFLMDNRLPLRVGPSGRIRLKGQMKFIANKNLLWFLCHPVLGSADDIISAGLHLTDLNLFDSTSELLITSMHQTREIEDVIEKGKSCIKELEHVRTQLLQYRKRNRNILYAVMPKHIAAMIQSGIRTYSLCESYPLVTIMFAYIMDFKMSTTHLKPSEIIHVLNEAANIFDDVTDRFDVFKVKTKINASYMFVAGLHDRSNVIPDNLGSLMSLIMPIESEEGNERNPFELNPTEIIAFLSLELLRASEHLINPMTRKPFGVKIGFHAGTAIGGLIGDQKLQYCLFGDAVTAARRITTTGETGRIHMSQTAYHHLIADNRFTVEYREQTDIKEKNINATYWLTGINKTSSTTMINKTAKLVRCPYSGRQL